MAETSESPEPINHKACAVLKASIHCEGCKRKVKKILTQVQGVDFVEVDTKQQKVTVTGSVDADTLIKKLLKSGKHAELWPQKPEEKTEKISAHGRTKLEKESKIVQQENPDLVTNVAKLEPQPSVEIPPAAKNCEASGTSLKFTTEKTDTTKIGCDAEVVSDASVKTSGEVQEKESKGKKTEAACSEPPQKAEKKEAAEKTNEVGGENGMDGKKKKKKGQSRKLSSNAPPPACSDDSEPLPTNQCPPRHHHSPSPTPHHDRTPQPLPPPVYGLSYNMAYNMSSYTAYNPTSSYNSYAYAYGGPETEPTPSDQGPYPRQPLDSFEMFSDENPNGCSIA